MIFKRTRQFKQSNGKNVKNEKCRVGNQFCVLTSSIGVLNHVDGISRLLWQEKLQLQSH